jgi:group I intron endonuclease
MIHYTYIISNTITNVQYIGVRSCKCNAINDNYWGSSKYLTEDINKLGSSNFIKQILAIWPTRETATEHEIKLHEFYNVSVNPMFYNKSIQTSNKFHTIGMPHPKGMLNKTHTLESRQKMSNSQKGIPKTAEHNKKNSEAHMGKKNPMYGVKHTAESLAKIRQASTGKNNPMYGVKHSNESKLAIAKSKKGKKCYNNGKIAKMYYPGTEPNEFTLGKKIKELK